MAHLLHSPQGTVLLSEAALNEAAHSCSEFDVELQLLYCSNSCVRKGFQATVYVASIMQNAVIDAIHDKVTGGLPVCTPCVSTTLPLSLQESLTTGEKASVRCRFLHHPEFLRVGSRVVMREGPTKATGEVSRLLPLKDGTATHTTHKHSSHC